MSWNWSRILAGIGIGGGIAGLAWYESLTQQQKQHVNQIAESYARDLFQKCLADLSPHQSRVVHAMTRNHFN